ncbi:FAD-dependent monooxygenase [Kitasatospora sp. GAS206B]|uniref:FAD-dependent monooxygenase n=1 Tax=unclassified Kitasatospora TaxID=2633591 RepID=UPI0035185FF0
MCDAIHAASPTCGNGANTALPDADLLRRCLIEEGEGRQDPLSAVDDTKPSRVTSFAPAAWPKRAK